MLVGIWLGLHWVLFYFSSIIIFKVQFLYHHLHMALGRAHW